MTTNIIYKISYKKAMHVYFLLLVYHILVLPWVSYLSSQSKSSEQKSMRATELCDAETPFFFSLLIKIQEWLENV